MKIANLLWIILLFLFLFQESFAHPREKCFYQNANGDSIQVTPEFLLSRGMEDQVKGFYFQQVRKKEVSEQLHKSAINFIIRFQDCLSEIGEFPGALTHYYLSQSYFEIGDFDKARKEIDKSISLDSEFRDSYIQKSRISIRQAKLEEASQYLEEKLNRYPKDLEFLFILGSLNLELKNFNKASLYFTSLHEIIMTRETNSKYRPMVMRYLGDLAFHNEEYKKAISHYIGYLSVQPNDLEINKKLAQCYYQMGEFSQSKAVLEFILQKFPENKEIEPLLAEMYFIESPETSFAYFSRLHASGKMNGNLLLENIFKVMNGELEAPRKFLEKFSGDYPHRLSSRLALIKIYKTMNLDSKLIRLYLDTAQLAFNYKQYLLAESLALESLTLIDSSQEFKENEARMHDFLTNCYIELEMPNRAIREIQKAIELANSDEQKKKYQLQNAYIYLSNNSKNYKKAIQIIGEVLQDSGKNPYARYLLGLAYFFKKDYNESVMAFSQAIEEDPENPNYFFYRGMAYDKMNQDENTIEDLKKSISLSPSNPTYYNYLGYFYADRNRNTEDSLELLKKAISLEPDNGAYQDSLGWVYFRLGKSDEALHHLSLAQQLLNYRRQDDPVVYDHLGDVFYDKGDLGNARENWKKSLKITESKDDKERIKSKLKKLGET
jgi:tetratricopeptide (TPR) repeat protein